MVNSAIERSFSINKSNVDVKMKEELKIKRTIKDQMLSNTI